MPRYRRMQFEGAFYHVMNRGRNRCSIFHNSRFYEAFLKAVAESCLQFKAVVHAFCLMPNHYHLFLETPLGNLSRIMRHINGVYTQRYHTFVGSDGTLFKGRYKSILVDSENYASALAAYIHNNPIAGENPLVKNLEDYPWSSYPQYLKKSNNYDWLQTGLVNSLSGVQEGQKNSVETFYARKNQSYIMGSDDFKQKLFDDKFSGDLEAAKYIFEKPSFDEIITRMSKILAISPAHIMNPLFGRSNSNMERKIAMLICQQACGYSRAEIAEHFGLKSPGGVGKALFNAKHILSDAELKNLSLLVLRDKKGLETT